MKKTLSLFMVLLFMTTLADAAPTTVINGARLNGVVIADSDVCRNAAIGDSCGGGKYAGTLNGYKYIVTPGGCTDSSTPTCAGGSDALTKKWANNSGTTAYGVNTGSTSTTDGPGNTTLLATNYTDTDAAKYCQNMDYGGYTDWFLPAKDELNLLYPNKAALGGFNTGAGHYYWTSTEVAPIYAWFQNFADGLQWNSGGKDYLVSFHPRCIRRY